MTIPSLQTLRAFDAAGRHQSYSKAGEEIGLTHGAVSRRIRDLEHLTGQQLFTRVGNAMVPTEAGRRLLAQVRNAIGLLQAIFPAVPKSKGQTRIAISLAPALALRWLVARLPSFREEHPEIDIALEMDPDPVDLARGPDGAIRYGAGPWPGTRSRLLARELLFPVCSPACRQRYALSTPADLDRAILLRHPWQSWAAWFAAAGLSRREPEAGPEYRDSSLLLEAAIAGEGVALARGLLVADALASGALVKPFETALPDTNAYHFVRSEQRQDPALDHFEHWLARTMAANSR